MLSSVLNSPRAIQVNIVIMRVFVKLKEVIYAHKEILHKLEQLEHKLGQHEVDIQTIFQTMRELMAPPKQEPKRKIGFHSNLDGLLNS